MSFQLEPLRADIQTAMRAGYDKLISVVETTAFQNVLVELFGLPRKMRPDFVRSVLLTEIGRISRDINLPQDVLLVRSSFGDRRPTLFCLKIYLPQHLWYPWQNVNITFDEFYSDDDIPRDDRAWRVGLGFDQQAGLIAAGINYRALAHAS